MELLGSYSEQEILAAIEAGAAYVTIQGFNFRILDWEPNSHTGSVLTETMELDAVIIQSEDIEIK